MHSSGAGAGGVPKSVDRCTIICRYVIAVPAKNVGRAEAVGDFYVMISLIQSSDAVQTD
jgi:hypothetical protein